MNEGHYFAEHHTFRILIDMHFQEMSSCACSWDMYNLKERVFLI